MENARSSPPDRGPIPFILNPLTLVGPPSWNRSENNVVPSFAKLCRYPAFAVTPSAYTTITSASTSSQGVISQETHHTPPNRPTHCPLHLALPKPCSLIAAQRAKSSQFIEELEIDPTRACDFVISGVVEEGVGEGRFEGWAGLGADSAEVVSTGEVCDVWGGMTGRMGWM